MLDRIFAFQHGGRCFLYAPLREVVLEVNHEALDWLERGRRSAVLDPDDPFIRELTELGLDGGDPPTSGSSEVGDFLPGSVSLFLTTDCNLRCVYCYASGGERAEELPWPVARAALDLVVDAVARRGGDQMSVHFHGGGEPTLAMPLLQRCAEHVRQRARDAGIKLMLSLGTNGVMATEAALWIADNLHSVTLSLDGPAAIHDHQRPAASGRSSYARAVRTAQIWDREQLTYGVRATVTAGSVLHLPRMVETLAFQTAARSIKLEPVFGAGRATRGAARPPDADRFVEAFLEARAVARQHGRELHYSGLRLDSRTSHFCTAVSATFCVTPSGDVTSCYEVSRPEDPRAGVFFFGAWDPANKVFGIDEGQRRRMLRLAVEFSPACAECFCRWHCAGDCPAKSVWDGTTRGPDPLRCHITRKLAAALLVERLEQGQ